MKNRYNSFHWWAEISKFADSSVKIVNERMNNIGERLPVLKVRNLDRVEEKYFNNLYIF